MLVNVISLCGCLDAKLYSAPIGEKSVAIEPENAEPEVRSADISIEALAAIRRSDTTHTRRHHETSSSP